MELAISREKLLFGWLLALAAIMWLFIVVGTLGIGLLYVLGAALFYLFTHSALIAMMKGNAVRITPEQFPGLHAKFVKACERLKMPMPEAYVLNGNGVLNAFATKFLGRNYVALMSDVLDSFHGDDDGAVNFYIGHELGHIHRKHLRWWPILIPTVVYPLLFPAYRRACEMTCDQYGRTCCDNPEDAARGLAALAAGGKLWKSMSLSAYTNQVKESGGFWMSYHEVTGTYPWLSKRASKIADPEKGEHKWPQRHPLAWVLGMFTPGFLPGAFLPIIIIYFGIIMAIAIPSILKFSAKVKEAQSMSVPLPETETLPNYYPEEPPAETQAPADQETPTDK